MVEQGTFMTPEFVAFREAAERAKAKFEKARATQARQAYIDYAADMDAAWAAYNEACGGKALDGVS